MTASAREIEREVEASRANLESTVEALKQKMSLGQVVDEATRYFADSGGSKMAANFGAQVRDNPLPLALVGVGLAWLMSGRGRPHVHSSRSQDGYGVGSGYDDASEYRRMAGVESSVYAGAGHADFSAHSEGLDDTWAEGDADREGSGAGGEGGSALHGESGLRRRAQGLGGAVSGMASGLGNAAAGVSSTASRAGSAAYHGASHMGSGALSGASRLGSRAQRSFSDVLEMEPLVMGALGIAVGAAIGALLPRTETEDRYLGERRDRIREEAEAFARQKLEQGKAVAAEALGAARTAAGSEFGLTGSQTSEKGGEQGGAAMQRQSSSQSAGGFGEGGL